MTNQPLWSDCAHRFVVCKPAQVKDAAPAELFVVFQTAAATALAPRLVNLRQPAPVAGLPQ
jgi:hypothetical protein